MTDDSTKRYGFTADDWADMVGAAYAVLAQTAQQKTTITYAKFCVRADLRMAPNEHAMSALLDDLADRSLRDGGFILSAVLVQSDGEHQPGGGFFKYATRKGLLRKSPTSDQKLVFWTEQIQRAYARFAAT